MKFRWSLPSADPGGAARLARELNVSRLLAQCLCNRGLAEASTVAGFLEPRLKHLADPFLLPHMQAAVNRLFQARERQELIVIFGDYDVDGVTSTALLVEALRALGWRVDYFLPRMDDGYGLSRDAVAKCVDRFNPGLLLAVDCGSNAREVISELQQTGVDVIVLDHHQVSSPHPPAVALVNPQLTSVDPAVAGLGQADFRELCSVGLGFKLAHALVKRGRETGLRAALEYDLRPLLDLVALGTIADLVPLRGENRILVCAGLQRLATTSRPGLIALKKVAGCPERVGCYEVGFQLGPRLNASGRLETAEQSLHLLLASDEREALPIAQALDKCNRERQQIERKIAEQALEAVRARFQPDRDYVVVEGRKEWHVGVVGIVASRVLQQFYRPVILMGGDGEYWRGSGRSIEGFDLGSALRQCHDLLVRHGGHAMAAGLTMAPARLEEFRSLLNDIARAQLSPELLRPSLRLDAEVRLEELTFQSLGELAKLQPVGQGNPSVQFCARNLTHARPPQRLGSQKQHVKMWVADGPQIREALWWSAGNELLPEDRFNLAFAPLENEYNGRRYLQLKVLDWCPATS